MPVFGKSLFETMLDGLQQQDEVEDDAAISAVRGFNSGFVGSGWNARADIESDPSQLFERFDPPPAIPPAAIPPDWLDRLSEAEIADDLALEACRSEQDIREKRRHFALENHPDRVADSYRQQATRRMMIANQLLDKALARLR